MHKRLLHLLISDFLPLLIRDHAHTGFHQHSYMISLALNIPTVLDIFLACIAGYLAVKEADPTFRLLADRYYFSAIKRTRESLASK